MANGQEKQLLELRNCLLRRKDWTIATLESLFRDYIQNRQLYDALTSSEFIGAVSYCGNNLNNGKDALIQDVYTKFIQDGKEAKRAANLTGVALFLAGANDSLTPLSPQKTPKSPFISISKGNNTPRAKRPFNKKLCWIILAVCVAVALLFAIIHKISSNNDLSDIPITELCRVYDGSISDDTTTTDCILSITYVNDKELALVVHPVYEPCPASYSGHMKKDKLVITGGPNLQIIKGKDNRIELEGKDNKHGLWSFKSR